MHSSNLCWDVNRTDVVSSTPSCKSMDGTSYHTTTVYFQINITDHLNISCSMGQTTDGLTNYIINKQINDSGYLSVVVQFFCWTLAAFSDSLFYAQSVGLLGRGMSPSQGPYLHTGQHKHRMNAHRHKNIMFLGIIRRPVFI
jgi:hypothetical protein